MVLSNKKLKQKLRASIAESLTSAVEHDPSDRSKTYVEHNLQPPQSLKQLLNSVSQKPRLSKREKKRIRTQDSETVIGNDIDDDGENDNKKKFEDERYKVVGETKESGNEKKRKRNGDKSEESKNLDLLGDDGENKEKKKKRKKKEKREEGELVEESGDVKKANKLKKKKKKQKKQKKKKKANMNDEEKKGDDGIVATTESNKDSGSQANGTVGTKVYVGGIPYNASENDIKTYFEGCGTITEIDYMTFPDSGKFRGIAIISFRINNFISCIRRAVLLYGKNIKGEENFELVPWILVIAYIIAYLPLPSLQTEGAVKRALALDGSEMDGFFLKIQLYKTTKANKTSDFAPKIIEGYNRIYVGNLSWDITDDDLRKLFSDCKISSIRLGTDKETGEFRGYAHVDFSDSLSLSMALKLDQEILCGRPVKISFAVPPKKGINTKSRSMPIDNVVTGNVTDRAGSTDDTGLGAVSGKIRRRTCYECGEKGHLSSACPKKTADQMNSNWS